jgi:diadenosine tetraphosphatase ApaH/serine/threonine PP2A family protein phosphatase
VADDRNWPSDGENDIYETGNGTTRSPFYSFIHYGATNQQHWFRHDADASQWHSMAMGWERSAIRLFRDGALVDTFADAAAIPDVAHHLCIQLDALKPSLRARVRMYVDYARIYTRA